MSDGVELTEEERRAAIVAGCASCQAAKTAGYETCANHRPIEFLGAIWGQAFISQPGTAHDIEEGAARNALRTWRPQIIHYHEQGKPCVAECHQIFPNDLPHWSGANPE